jgi:2-dehydropantoate 2-reductase
MKIAVIGAGAVGCLVAGYLKLKNEDVELVGRPAAVHAIRKQGIKISGVRGSFTVAVDIAAHLQTRPDLAIITTKNQDIDDVLTENIYFFRGTTILTIQNGIQADQRVARFIPKEQILSSILMFGANCLELGNVTHEFEGDWILGTVFGNNPKERLTAAGTHLARIFPVRYSTEFNGMKYLKLFINSNHCIPAILGLSIQEAFSDLSISSLGVSVWREALDVVSSLGIRLASIPGFPFPVENLWKITTMPWAEAAAIVSEITTTRLSNVPLYGSILQSIKRGRPSEIDYINGIIVKLAEQNELQAPLNKRLVAMVHEVERTGRFYSKDELIRTVRDLVAT